MHKKYILPVLLMLLLLLPACTTAECPTLSSVPPPATRESSAPAASSAASGVSPSSSEQAVSSEAPQSSSVPAESSSSGLSSSGAAVSSTAPASSVPPSSSKAVVLNSSLPPKASPGVSGTPMPPVTALMPQASGSAVFSQNGAEIDYSNASQGYIMVKYGGSGKIKVLVYYNGGSSFYQYNIPDGGGYTVLPLQSGSGTYRVRFMQNVSGGVYAELCSTEIGASIGGSGYTLYPNQYVNYTRSSAAVAKAKSLCAQATSNSAKVSAIYRFITVNVKYDYAKANSVQSGYLPDVDSTLASKKGICFDYSALMAAMCRSQGIPTRLVIGTASVGYHAWNEVYLGGWIRYDSTFGAAGQTVSSYTAEKYY
jgi:hypothetical protein